MDNYIKATKYLNANKPEKALRCFKKSRLDFKELHLNMGNCYKLLGDDIQAIACYQRAADHNTPFANHTFGAYPLALTNLGLMHYCYNNDKIAQEYYQEALAIAPLHYDAIWNYASSLLRQCSAGVSQEWSVAWKMYEYRFKRSNPTRLDTRFSSLWDGFSSGDEICVLSEQGLGDKIMFGRYLSGLKDYFKKIRVQCHESLDWVFRDYEVCREASGLAVPICSLPLVFDKIPNAEWIQKPRGIQWFGKIGVCWQGSKTHINNKFRSTTEDMFLRNFNCSDLINVNPEASGKFIKSAGCSTWEETAQVLLGLQCLITVDTSVAHMAGSLGVRTLLLQPFKETDFRWGYSGPSLWYPSVTVVENNQDWNRCFQDAKKLL